MWHGWQFSFRLSRSTHECWKNCLEDLAMDRWAAKCEWRIAVVCVSESLRLKTYRGSQYSSFSPRHIYNKQWQNAGVKWNCPITENVGDCVPHEPTKLLSQTDSYGARRYLASDESTCGNKQAEIFGWCADEGNWCSGCGEDGIQRDVDCSEKYEEEIGLITREVK